MMVIEVPEELKPLHAAMVATLATAEAARKRTRGGKVLPLPSLTGQPSVRHTNPVMLWGGWAHFGLK